MADFDKLSDAQGFIINFIEKKARGLLYEGGTEYDFSPWIQAALLLEKTVIPCEYYVPETLLEFAEEVIEEAKVHGCEVERYQVDGEGKKVNARIWNYTETIAKIEEWVRKKTEIQQRLQDMVR
jgi:hypothetical protein